jgi:hypothetical protein
MLLNDFFPQQVETFKGEKNSKIEELLGELKTRDLILTSAKNTLDQKSVQVSMFKPFFIAVVVTDGEPHRGKVGWRVFYL